MKFLLFYLFIGLFPHLITCFYRQFHKSDSLPAEVLKITNSKMSDICREWKINPKIITLKNRYIDNHKLAAYKPGGKLDDVLGGRESWVLFLKYKGKIRGSFLFYRDKSKWNYTETPFNLKSDFAEIENIINKWHRKKKYQVEFLYSQNMFTVRGIASENLTYIAHRLKTINDQNYDLAQYQLDSFEKSVIILKKKFGQ